METIENCSCSQRDSKVCQHLRMKVKWGQSCRLKIIWKERLVDLGLKTIHLCCSFTKTSPYSYWKSFVVGPCKLWRTLCQEHAIITPYMLLIFIKASFSASATLRETETRMQCGYVHLQFKISVQYKYHALKNTQIDRTKGPEQPNKLGKSCNHISTKKNIRFWKFAFYFSILV